METETIFNCTSNFTTKTAYVLGFAAMTSTSVCRLHCKKKKRAMHTKYGVLCLSQLEHLIWREVTPNFWCVFYAKLGVLSHQLSVLSH